MATKSISLYTLKLVKSKSRRFDLETCSLNCPQACCNVIEMLIDMKSEPVEKFGIITADIKLNFLGTHIISVGVVNFTNARAREIFLPAMINNASNVILFHNHPSGNLTPSTEDLMITEQCWKAGEMLDIRVLDHIILGKGSHISLKREGYFQAFRWKNGHIHPFCCSIR